MKAEIISVGTELLLGHTVNLDAALLARELAALGIDLVNVQTVGDNCDRLFDALRLAAGRCDIIITTGGLGPTDDDLTKAVVAKFAGKPLVEDAESAARLREYFGKRPMSQNQSRQAFLPKGALVFPNSKGTAPGCCLKFGKGQSIIMLPGPPGELAAMLDNSVRPYLQGLANSVIYSTIIRTFGIGEGAAAEKIKDLMALANPTVAPYASEGEMFVKITAKAENEAKARAICEPIAEEISGRLGAVVYGQDVDSLEAVVLKELIAAGSSIATAESCTGGLVAKRLTDLAGASEVFQLGLVTYSNQTKESVLGVPELVLRQHGAVSGEVAMEMAKNAARLGKSDLGIGITGIAGPTGGSKIKPVGLVYIALAAVEGCYLNKMEPEGKYLGREWVRRRASSMALDMVRRYLTGLPVQQ